VPARHRQPERVGEIFNITDGEFVSKKRFFEAVADGLDGPGQKLPAGAGWWPGSWRIGARRSPPRETAQPAADHGRRSQSFRRPESRLLYRQGAHETRLHPAVLFD